MRFRLNILLSILDRRFCITPGTIQCLIIPLIGGVRFDHLLQLWSPGFSTEKGYFPPLLGRVIPGVVSSACATLPFSNNHSPSGPASIKGLSRVAVPSCLPTSDVREFLRPTFLSALVFVGISYPSHSNGYLVIPHHGFNLPFSNA